MAQRSKLRLFEGFGVEMEYMIVDRETLQVKPISDEVLKAQAGELTSDVERGAMGWSNELVLHVLELKTNGPAQKLTDLAFLFHQEVRRVNQLLEPFNAMLLPTGAHPLMDPFQETKLWPHEASEIYQAYNKIFNCQGHGWSNLQSTHLNLPFANDEEFGRLHAAIRLVLPLIPALSAASPILDKKVTGFLDTRLEVYRKNQQKVPLIAGQIVPEAVFSEQQYQEKIFQPMFQAIAPFDDEDILQEEFLNSRGAIARFSRGAIEIRIIDNQECPLADISILVVVTEVLKKLVQEEWSRYEDQQKMETDALASVFLQSVKNGPETEVSDTYYLSLLGVRGNKVTLTEVWRQLWQRVRENETIPKEIVNSVDIMINNGCLSQRILHTLGGEPTEEQILAVYRKLANCLATNQLYVP
ncbi:MAG: carboxylate-amine ligase [Rufibacter sp.]